MMYMYILIYQYLFLNKIRNIIHAIELGMKVVIKKHRKPNELDNLNPSGNVHIGTRPFMF